MPVSVALLVGVLAISWASILVRWCSAPALSIAALRLGLAALVMLGLRFWRPSAPLPKRRGDLWRVLGSGLLLGLHFAAWISSLEYTSVASSVVLVTTSPLFVALGGRLWLGERLTARQILGMLVATAGAILVATAETPVATPRAQPWLGNGLALLGALCAAGYLLLGRSLRHSYTTLDYVARVYAVAAGSVACLCLVTGAPLLGFSQRDWVLLLLMALVPQGIGHTVLNWALRFAPAASVAVTILGEPIGSTVLAMALLHEGLSPLQAAGGALTLTGVCLGAWPARREIDR